MDLQYINAAAYTKTDNNAKKIVMNCFKAVALWIDQYKRVEYLTTPC